MSTKRTRFESNLKQSREPKILSNPDMCTCTLVIRYSGTVMDPFYSLTSHPIQHTFNITGLFRFLQTASCSDPGNPLPGRAIGDDFSHGKRVSFICPRDYVMKGARTITCSDGQWSDNTPNCRGEFCLLLKHVTCILQ